MFEMESTSMPSASDLPSTPTIRSVVTPVSILLAEDDERQSRQTIRYLESHGLRIELVTSSADALQRAIIGRFDVILLDVRLQGQDGFEVCRQLRAALDTPIVMLTEQSEEADRVKGLEGGADDFLTKPFSSRELLARIRAQVRRSQGRMRVQRELQVGPLLIDPNAMSVQLHGRPVALTTYEFRLLQALAERAGRVVSRDQIMHITRGTHAEAFDRSIDVHISHIRSKLGDNPRKPQMLKTVRGAGYLLAVV